jgi:hypothetical protein
VWVAGSGLPVRFDFGFCKNEAIFLRVEGFHDYSLDKSIKPL